MFYYVVSSPSNTPATHSYVLTTPLDSCLSTLTHSSILSHSIHTIAMHHHHPPPTTLSSTASSSHQSSCRRRRPTLPPLSVSSTFILLLFSLLTLSSSSSPAHAAPTQPIQHNHQAESSIDPNTHPSPAGNALDLAGVGWLGWLSVRDVELRLIVCPLPPLSAHRHHHHRPSPSSRP